MSSHKAAPVIPDPKGYESGDLDLRPVIKWMAILMVFIVVMTLITWPIYIFFLPHSQVGEVTRFSMKTMAPEPRLQAVPKVEMKDFRMKEAEMTSTYGWADREKGMTRMPIEKALQKTLEEGADGLRLTPVTGAVPAGQLAARSAGDASKETGVANQAAMTPSQIQRQGQDVSPDTH